MSAASRLVADAWNEMAQSADLPMIRLMTGKRLTQLNARIKEAGLDGVLEAIKAVGKSSFCCGSRGWRADFDFLLQPKSFVRLLEGSYANKRETFKNGALEILMREAEARNRPPVLDCPPIRPEVGLPLLAYAAGDD